MTLETFTFNSFQVNTYVIATSLKNAIIIDAGCSNKYEEQILEKYLANNNLKPKMLINTHAHIDHILGNARLKELFNVDLYAHEESQMYYEQVSAYASYFNIEEPKKIIADKNIKDSEKISVDEIKMKFIYTPGHAKGSVCIYIEDEKIIFSGDLLFKNGIGRSDLPGGDQETLIKSINEKIFTLPDNIIVYPGHGPSTTIGEEKTNNYFTR